MWRGGFKACPLALAAHHPAPPSHRGAPQKTRALQRLSAYTRSTTVDLGPGTLINNKYRITSLIGQGGMGAVYAGENTAIARRVAIKVLHAAVAQQQGIVERFEREAQAAGRIGNDHILEVLDLGTLPDGSRFMVMEFLDGEDLEQYVERNGPMPPDVVAPLARQLLTGLSAAHGAGIIHRDLKPENVYILKEKAGQKNFVKIIDFGISKFTAQTGDMKMTATGAVMGTPYYMAPEQARGSREADHRSDLYACGVILYKVVTGTVPFQGNTFNELLFNIVLSNAPTPRQLVPDLDPAFESIITKAMAKDPAERFQSANEFIAALDAWQARGASVELPAAAQTRVAEGGTEQPDPDPFSKTRPSQIPPDPASQATRLGLPAEPAMTTGASWTNSSVTLPRRSNSSIWIAGSVVVGMALVGLSAWIASDDEPVADPAREVQSAEAPTLAAAPAGTVEMRAPPPVVPPPTPRESGSPEPSGTKDLTQSVEEQLNKQKAAPTATSKQTVKRATKKSTKRSTSRPPARSEPAPQKAKPPPPPKRPVNSNELDFGY
jgi:eukaryotic-like serine/threonine-protein kinase